ncbi:hypothetical protein [Singulisphaera sp. PoT]|uniref:hypothetical protein n=1 Tax=Singulisphaera sp. PoT TaxID=3411797 RepID=UPI003BF5CAA6
MAKKNSDDVSIGKFDILATYTYAKALLDGLDDEEARVRGMVAAIMGARAKLGRPGSTAKDYRDDKSAAERKKKSKITAESFDRQVSGKMGPYFGETFLPALKGLVEAGLSYDDVKRLVKIPKLWGAKIGGRVFEERAVPPRRGPR